MTINIWQFFQNIEGLGCLHLDQFEVDGEQIHVFLSRNGNRRVLINVTDEDILRDVAEGLLWDLECGDMVNAVLPPLQ